MRSRSIVDPIPYHIKAEQNINVTASVVLQQEKINFQSTQEYIHYITHKMNNKMNKDGRICFEMADGSLGAVSVSPYSNTFLNNIEKGVFDLVVALNQKRYLTCSSCEGHGNTFRRYVTLAFGDEDSRDYVKNMINSLNLYGVKCKLYNSLANVSFVQNKDTNKPEMKSVKKRSEEEKLTVANEKEIEAFNIQFHRSYENYYFMELVISDEIKWEKEGFIKECHKTWLKLVKKFYCDMATKKIVKLINSDNFKKYKF